MKNALVDAGYMKRTEDLSEEEINYLMDFISTNKKFLKDNEK